MLQNLFVGFLKKISLLNILKWNRGQTIWNEGSIYLYVYLSKNMLQVGNVNY